MLLFRVFSVVSVKSILASAFTPLTISGSGVLCGFNTKARIKIEQTQTSVLADKCLFFSTVFPEQCLFFSTDKQITLILTQEQQFLWISLKINHNDLQRQLINEVICLPCEKALVNNAALCTNGDKTPLPILESALDDLLTDHTLNVLAKNSEPSGIIADCALNSPKGAPPLLTQDISTVSPKLQKLYSQLFLFIEQNIGSDISVAQLSDVSGYSLRKLNAILRQYSGCTASEFINRQRLEHAKFLLASPDLTITEIADMAGFKSVSYFSRQFKGRFGISPQNYRLSASAD